MTVLVIGNSRVEASGNKNTTFVKTYRFYDFNHARGIWPTKEGDYIFTGDVTVGLQSDAFISKLNKQGNPIWTKLIGSRVHYSGPMGKGPVDDAGYLAVQLKDGSYLLVGQTRGYVGDAEAKIFETPVDIFLSKFSQDGKHLWTQTVGDLADDTPSGLWPTNNGGFLLFGTLEELGAGADIGGDTDHYFFLAKFNAEGKKEWIKKTNFNIGGTMGEQEQVNFSTEQEDEDGFALVGTIPADEVLKQDDEEIGSHMPTVVKLDKNNNVVWAKSIEAIPTEYLIAKPTDNEIGYTESYMKARWTAGSFSAIQKTPDNGYLAIGFLLPFTKGYADYNATYETITGTPLLAVKLDRNGKFQWAKTLKTGLYSFDNEFRIAKTKDNDFIIMQNIMSGGKKFMGRELYDIYIKKSEEVAKLYPVDYKPGDEEKNPTLKKAIEEKNKASSNWAATMTKHIALMKIDPELNVKWAKKIGPEVKPIAGGAGAPYEFTGRDIRIDKDEGIIIAGTHGTDVVCFVSFGEKFYCQDALLIKLDANVELTDNSRGLVSSHTSVSQEDLSQYITTRDVEPKIIDYELRIKKQKPSVPAKQAKKVTTLLPFKEEVKLSERLKGYILLQVESYGEAYYVLPYNGERYYLGRPQDAFKIMRDLGLGATHEFITSHTIYPSHVIGKILIDVGDYGKAYYIYPKDRKAYYLGRPADAFKVMRELSLGIKNSDLNKIQSSVSTFLSYIPAPSVLPQPKTWAERNFEGTKIVEPINEKSREIHNELLLILNQLFNNKVKLRDNFGGITLDYTFGRLVTQDDVSAMKNYLEELGYKDTDLSSGGKLVMTKIGLTLNLSFAIKNRIQGTLEVTW